MTDDQWAAKSINVLVVEDDLEVADALTEFLRRYGYHVVATASGHDVVGLADGVDVVLLDLNLPDLDGIEVCRRLRHSFHGAVIMVSARGDEIDRVLGLRSGADDYLVKPFSGNELLARIEAVLRRRPPDAEDLGRAVSDRRLVVLGDIEIDLTAHRVRLRGGEVSLSRKEYEVLAMLAELPGAMISRKDLIRHVWGDDWVGPTRTLDVHISALRLKLDDPTLIETVRGVGYRLRD
jgi:DNA-binding response OmpR family regulator